MAKRTQETGPASKLSNRLAESLRAPALEDLNGDGPPPAFSAKEVPEAEVPSGSMPAIDRRREEVRQQGEAIEEKKKELQKMMDERGAKKRSI